MTPSDRANFQQPMFFFSYSHRHRLCIFASEEQVYICEIIFIWLALWILLLRNIRHWFTDERDSSNTNPLVWIGADFELLYIECHKNSCSWYFFNVKLMSFLPFTICFFSRSAWISICVRIEKHNGNEVNLKKSKSVTPICRDLYIDCHKVTFMLDQRTELGEFAKSWIFWLAESIGYNKLFLFYFLWVLHTSVSWLYFTRAWMTRSLLRFPGLFSVFKPILTML